jgi:glycosyltransferase involved in cell wall biosynthesis
MVLSGTQVNAIELAAALRDLHGCEVVLFGAPGPMVKFAEQRGLRFLPSPEASFCPSPSAMKALRRAVQRERPDLLYVWEWSQCLEAYLSVYLPMRIPMLVTDMLHDVTSILPKRVPTTFGVPILVDEARAAGRLPVEFIPPPVDVTQNAPGVVDGEAFRRRCGVAAGEVVMVTVSRLDPDMKTESLLRTLDVVEELGAKHPVRFIITGDGASRAELEARAAAINVKLRRTAVVFSGALLDPRPAYAAADIVVGMGGSALRSMAFAKPTVVVGKNGFAKLLCPETSESIYYNGNYGSGDGTNATLRAAVQRLLEHPGQIGPLGQFSREFVVRHFGMEEVSKRLMAFCEQAVAEPPSVLHAATEALRMSGVYLRERTFQRTWPPVPAFAVES